MKSGNTKLSKMRQPMKHIRLYSLLSFSILFILLHSTLSWAGVDSIADANNKFTFDLYSKLSGKKGNIFFSPYSISTALAMTYEGARGITADEMEKVLHFPKDSKVRREGFFELINEINNKDKKYQLRTANAL